MVNRLEKKLPGKFYDECQVEEETHSEYVTQFLAKSATYLSVGILVAHSLFIGGSILAKYINDSSVRKDNVTISDYVYKHSNESKYLE